MQPIGTASEAEIREAAAVRDAVIEAVVADVRIVLPKRSDGGGDIVRFEPNRYGGQVGPLLYQVEGEEDLLHVIVTRVNGGRIAVEEGREVLDVLFPDVPSALIWLKPGEFSQHFYLGHDDLLTAPSKPLLP